MNFVKNTVGNTEILKETLWAYILGYIEDHKYSPTLEEMKEKLKEETGETFSREHCRKIVGYLVEEGKLELTPNKWRNIRIVTTERVGQA